MMTVTRKRDGGVEPNLENGGAKPWKKKTLHQALGFGAFRGWGWFWVNVSRAPWEYRWVYMSGVGGFHKLAILPRMK